MLLHANGKVGAERALTAESSSACWDALIDRGALRH